jgi:diguanylate cyclase (GGDEF) domain
VQRDESHLAAVSGAVLFVGAGLLALVNSFASGSLAAQGTNVGLMRVLAGLSLVSAAVTWSVPWARVGRVARLSPAVWGLVLLVWAGQVTGYSQTPQAAMAYPVFFVMILAWLGLTQPRGTATVFAPVILAVSVWVAWEVPGSSVPLAGLVLVVVTSVVVAETIAWAMGRNRRQMRALQGLVAASAELRDVMGYPEGLELAAAAALTVLHASTATVFAAEECCDESAPAHVRAAFGEARSRAAGANIAVALVGPSGPNAVVDLHRPARDGFSRGLMELLSSELGGRLEQLRLIDALAEQTLHDALTGVGSRRHADALVQSLRAGDALMIIDIDHFKTVNDTVGHRGGDRILEQLGSHLALQLRDRDAVARYGGDEFVVRLHPGDGDPREIAQRLLDTWTQNRSVPAFSVGIAVHEADHDVTATFAAADTALYAAKRDGGARIGSARQFETRELSRSADA